MTRYLPLVVLGITNGSIYALAAVGLVLTYRTSGIFNFAHGAQAALAAYLMFEFRERMGLAWPLAGLLTLILAGLVAGLILERIADSLASASVPSRVAATVGLLLAIQGTLQVVFGFAAIPMRTYLPQKLFRLPGVSVSAQQLIITAFVLVSVVALYLFFSRAKFGVAVQAVVEDPALLGLRSINPGTIRRLSWLVGASFAALSGMLLAPTFTLDAPLLTLIVFFAFGAAAIGGFSSLPLTYVGGLAIGLSTELLKGFLQEDFMARIFDPSGPIRALPPNLPFLVLFIALLVTPKGRLVERGSQVIRRPLPPLRFSRRTTAATIGVAAVIGLGLPHVVDTKLPLYTTALAYVILFLSLRSLVRMSGQVSLCQITFAAVGAVTAARAIDAGVPWGLAVLLAGVVTVPVGAFVAIPAIRLSGIYLAIATFGFGLVVQRLVYSSFLMFGKSFALPSPRPKLPGFDTTTDTGYYYVVLGMTVAACLLVVAVRKQRLGVLLRAFRDSPVAVDSLGTNTNELKVYIFCFSAFLAGVAGALIAPVTGTATVVSFDFTGSLLILAAMMISGRQPILSAVVAAVLFIVVPGYIGNADLRELTPVAFGVGAVAAAMFGNVPLRDRFSATLRLPGRRTSPSRLDARRVPSMEPVTS